VVSLLLLCGCLILLVKLLQNVLQGTFYLLLRAQSAIHNYDVKFIEKELRTMHLIYLVHFKLTHCDKGLMTRELHREGKMAL
jgi:hypothetical protein